jgi:hypothetical protein
MKHIATISLLFSLFMLYTQCNKDDDTWGAMSAVKDGISWKAKPYCQNSFLDDQLLDFTSQVLSVEGYLREDLNFASIPKKQGVYKLAAYDPTTFGGQGRKQCTATYSTYTGDGQGEGLYTVTPVDTVSYLEITKVSDKTLEGKFAATLLLTANSKSLYPYLKDTIVFTEGYFFTEIKD